MQFIFAAIMIDEKERAVQKALRKLSAKVGKTLFQQNMLEDNDKVLIGLSGGKDSYALLEALADRRKHLPFKIEIIATHIAYDNVGYKIDTDYMQRLCDSLAIPFFLIQGEVDLQQAPDKSACFVCSWFRRKQLFAFAKDNNCNKLALGHHLDDAVQTMLMNQIWHGSFSSLPFKLKMFDGRMHLIRPMLELREEEIVAYTSLRNFPASISNCPYDKETIRQNVRDLIAHIKTLTPGALKNMYRSMSHISFEYLPDTKTPTYHDQFGCLS